MRLPGLCSASGSIIAIVLANQCHAQTPKDAPAAVAATGGASASEDNGEIIVTAQRRSEALARVPVAIIAISSQILDQRGIRSEADLQTAAPGLLVRSTSGANQLNFALRGQSIDALTNSAPAVLPYFNEIAVPSGGTTALYDLESVQVLKGPQGTLFGRNSTGGAVLYTSRHPVDEFGGYITGRLGNFAYKSVEGAINIPLVSDVLSSRFSGFQEYRRGYVLNLYDNSRVGSTKRYAFRASVDFRTGALKNSLVVDYLHSGGTNVPGQVYNIYPNSLTAAFFGPSLDTVIGAPGAWQAYLNAHTKSPPAGIVAFANEQINRSPSIVDADSDLIHRQTNLIVSNITTYGLGNGMTFKNIFGYLHSRTRDGYETDGTPYDVSNNCCVDPSRAGTIGNLKEYTEEAQIQGDLLNHRLSYTAGVYYLNQTTFHRDSAVAFDLAPFIPPAITDVLANVKTKSYAGYGQIKYDLTRLTGIEGFSVTGALRYTSEKYTSRQLPGSTAYNIPGASNFLETKSQRLNWQFGLQQQLNPKLLLYVTTRRSFRSGGFNFDAFPFPGNAASGGAKYKPEIVTDVEGGVKYNGYAGGIPLSVNTAAYKLWVKNSQRIAFVLVNNANQALTVNVPEAQIYGVEADTQVRPTAWLTLGVSGAYTHGEFTRNTAILMGQTNVYGPYPDTPEWSGSFYTDLSFPIGDGITKLNLHGDLYGQSSFYYGSLANTLTPGVKLSGYIVANFRAGLEDVLHSGVSVSAVVKNAFDRKYFVGGVAAGNVLGLNTAIIAPPRTFYMEASVKF